MTQVDSRVGNQEMYALIFWVALILVIGSLLMVACGGVDESAADYVSRQDRLQACMSFGYTKAAYFDDITYCVRQTNCTDEVISLQELRKWQ